MNSRRGFTLIELMIVLVVMGILAVIAVPALQEYLVRGKITEATASLAEGRIRAEQFFQDNKTYQGAPCPANTASFTFACNLAATTYTITATGNGTATGFNYTINESNTKGSTTRWGNNASCWVTRKGGAC